LAQPQQLQLVVVVLDMALVVAVKRFQEVHQAAVAVAVVIRLVNQVVQALVVHLLHLAVMLLVQETLVVTAL
jgi:hypothetical protein